MQKYEPAYQLDQSDEQLTSKEIFDRIINVTGDFDFTIMQVAEYMEKSGFVFEYIFDEFKWLLKTKQFSKTL